MIELVWLLAGGIISWLLFSRSASKRDFYVVETVGITEDAGGKMTDIELVAGSPANYRYDITPSAHGYLVHLKGQREIFAVKTFDIFDDHAAAREKFDQLNNLFLSVHTQGWVAHRIFLWAVTARNRAAVSGRLVKSAGEPRKLMETDYSVLLRFWKP